MTYRLDWVAAAVASALLVSWSSSASANERRFTYTYGSDVLAPGQMELEPWTTLRLGKEAFFFGMDHRLEFEAGVADGVQTAFYMNFGASSQDVIPPAATTAERQTEVEWKGISWEWKFKALDNVADPLGLGFYLEPGIGPTEGEIEGKLLLDKRAGDFYVAYNPVVEYEFVFDQPGQTKHEIKVENDLGLAVFITRTVALGLEVRNLIEVEVGEGFEGSTFFAGPTVSFSRTGWWVAMTVLPQIGSIGGEEEGEEEGEDESPFDLRHHERIEMRLLMGFDL